MPDIKRTVEIAHRIAQSHKLSVALFDELRGESAYLDEAMKLNDFREMAACLRRQAAICDQRAEQFRRTALGAMEMHNHTHGGDE